MTGLTASSTQHWLANLRNKLGSVIEYGMPQHWGRADSTPIQQLGRLQCVPSKSMALLLAKRLHWHLYEVKYAEALRVLTVLSHAAILQPWNHYSGC